MQQSDYQILPPTPELEPFVEYFWVLTASASEAPQDEIVLPDGKTEFIVHFGDDFLKLEQNGLKSHFVRQGRVLIAGQLTKHIVLRPSGNVGILSARFKPAGANRFFDLPFEKLVDQIVDFSAWNPQLATRLQKSVSAARTNPARLELMRDELTKLLKEESKEDFFVRQACRYIMQSDGAYTVKELEKLIGFSERQLQRKFLKQLGISPKALSKIARFQKFISLSRDSTGLSLTDAAEACGYYDQSHFIRDFTEFSGSSPLKYLSSTHVMSDHMTTPLPK